MFVHPIVFESSARVLLPVEVGWTNPQPAFSCLSVGNSKGFAWLSWPADTGCRRNVGNDCK